MAAATIDELLLGDEPDEWTALGFSVRGRVCDVGGVRLRLGGPAAGHGIVRWSLRDVSSTAFDGLLTDSSSQPPREPAPVHPNGAIAVDHVVVMTGDFDRTAEALAAAGLQLRRVREAPPRPRPVPDGSTRLSEAPPPPTRLGFYRLGEVLLELVEAPGTGPARFWGLVFVVEDLDACAALLGDELGSIRPAVQPGRRIATLRASANLGPQVAMITADRRD